MSPTSPRQLIHAVVKVPDAPMNVRIPQTLAHQLHDVCKAKGVLKQDYIVAAILEALSRVDDKDLTAGEEGSKMAKFGQQRWAGSSRKEERMANGSLTAHATLVQAMKRLVGVREMADHLLQKQETLVWVTIGGVSAQVQRNFLIQVLDAESGGLTELVRRLLPGKPPEQVTDASE